MRRVALVTLLCALGGFPSRCASRQPPTKPLHFCAAFSQQGDLAEVTITGQALNLEMTRVDGTRQSGRATIRTDQYRDADCSVFLSSDGKLAAVVTRVPGENPESVHVWDLVAAKWRSSFELAPRTGLEGRIRVRGFWKGGHDMAVESDKLLDSRGIKQAFALALVDTMGSVVAGPRLEEPVGALDAERGALWIDIPGSATDCSRSPASFTSNSLASEVAQTDAPTVPCSCFAGGLHGFASGGLPVGAQGKHDGIGTGVWSCPLGSKPQKLLLSSPPKQFLDRWVESGPADLEVSPQGSFFGVVVEVTRWSHFDTQRAEWNELHVFQTAPFREIGKLGPVKGCGELTAFAVGDADGKARVAVNWCGKWSTETMSDVVAASHH